MNQAAPFDSIESAHDFVRVFTEAIAEARRDVESDIQRELSSKAPRRLDAFRLAAYNLEKLELHLSKSRRILNDLRSLRRLLFEERSGSAAKPGQKPAAVPAAAKAVAKAAPAVPAAVTVKPAPRPTVVA